MYISALEGIWLNFALLSVNSITLNRWVPVYADPSKKLGVMSIGFLLQNRDDAVVWRGPKKNGKPLKPSVQLPSPFSV